MRAARLLFAAASLQYGPACAAAIEEIVVTEGLPELEARAAYAVTRISAQDIAAAPDLRLDDVLRQVPGFSLFRRASSLLANPTTQGVTLRGIGPNGAGRTLVLLDGVPLNDPFGGWVYWAAVDPAMLAGADVVRGGGAGPFGNQALAGAVVLESRRPAAPSARAEARYGSFDTLDLSAGASGRFGAFGLAVSGHYGDSDGIVLRPEGQRGAADVPAASETGTVRAAVDYDIAADTRLILRSGYFKEERDNGVALAVNATDAVDVSAGLVRDKGRDGVSVQATAFYRARDFAQTFSAVLDDARSQVRLVLDQFDVPAWGAGVIGLARIPLFDDDTLEIGADIRRLDGETNERFRNLGDGFTRRRTAGGDQWLAGAWIEYAGGLSERLSLAGGLRADYWRTDDGIRREADLQSGAVLRDDTIADRDDGLINGRLGITYDATPAIRLRTAGYTGFRLPTLNEFFRPFRVGNDITEANARLDAERLYGLEAGAEYRPLNSVRVSLDYFRNWLEDGVGNVTLAEGPGVFPPAGFVPAGGTLRQRQNIAEIVADGVEVSADLAAGPALDLQLRYLFVDARVTDGGPAPELTGREVAQSPDHTLYAAAYWRPLDDLGLSFEGRYVSGQFDDDRNSRRLDDFLAVDAALFYQAADGVTVFVAGENIFSADIESQIGGDGLVTRAQPQFFSGGVRLRY